MKILLNKIKNNKILCIICLISVLILIWSLSRNNLVEKFDIEDKVLYNRYRLREYAKNKKNLELIEPKELENYVDNILQNKKSPIILIISGDPGPHSCISPKNYKNFLENKNIIHCFAENWFDKLDNKLTILPCGTESKIMIGEKKHQEKELLKISNKILDLKNKNDNMILCNSHLKLFNNPLSGTIGNPRKEMYNILKNREYIHFWKERKPHIETWKLHKNYSYELCPEGNALDTHRFYEAILLNTIPIVIKNSLEPLYRLFPCIILDKWEDLNIKNLLLEKEKIQDNFNKNKLYLNYWTNLIDIKLNQLYL